MKKMQCARGGDALTAPFFEIAEISYTGNVAPEEMAQVQSLARWSTRDERGQPKADAYYFCAADFFELIALMEAWRTGGLAGAKAFCEQVASSMSEEPQITQITQSRGK